MEYVAFLEVIHIHIYTDLAIYPTIFEINE